MKLEYSLSVSYSGRTESSLITWRNDALTMVSSYSCNTGTKTAISWAVGEGERGHYLIVVAFKKIKIFLKKTEWSVSIRTALRINQNQNLRYWNKTKWSMSIRTALRIIFIVSFNEETERLINHIGRSRSRFDVCLLQASDSFNRVSWNSKLISFYTDIRFVLKYIVRVTFNWRSWRNLFGSCENLLFL